MIQRGVPIDESLRLINDILLSVSSRPVSQPCAIFELLLPLVSYQVRGASEMCWRSVPARVD